MKWRGVLFWSILSAGSLRGAQQLTAANLAQALQQIALDPNETYRVRDLRLRRGDVTIYLNEGVLSFASEINGRRIAAVFTTKGVDAGDAELVLIPPQPAERRSLASFVNTPNLDEHFSSAVLLFSDQTRDQVLEQLLQTPVRKLPEVATELGPIMDPVLQSATSHVSTQLVRSLLDEHTPDHGFFYSVIVGREIGPINFLYEPDVFEPVTVGRLQENANGTHRFQLWAAYRPRGLPSFEPPQTRISDYRIEASIDNELSLSAKAAFDFIAPPHSGRTIALNISTRLKIDSATVDGQPAEAFQGNSSDFQAEATDSEFVLVPAETLTAGQKYRIAINYHGSVIRRVSQGSFLVSERNVWYPHTPSTLANFDLTFHCPDRFQLVSTGELVSEEVHEGVRTIHRVTRVPEQLAGFNLGEYASQALASGPYRVECYADKSAAADMNRIPQATVGILSYYTQAWTPLPIHTIAVTPVAGYFGQGFPGLIYLSSTAYLAEKDRPNEVRNERGDIFFSQVLLPHEIAHQWWGNVVTSANYRADWLMEAMANYSALQFIDHTQGSAMTDFILDRFRQDLLRAVDGQPLESTGPVDFGTRLLAKNEQTWHTIVYEKGSWILHMLRERMGDAAFRQMQVALLTRYSGKPITNEEFRAVASSFLPSGQPDKSLTGFFETWVYGTGLPEIRMDQSGSTVEVTGVPDDFTADLPIICGGARTAERTVWMRIVSGANTVPGGGQKFCHLPSLNEYLYR